MRKLGAMIVSLAMVLVTILGNATVVNADDATPIAQGTFGLVLLDDEGKEVTGNVTPMEIGDVVTVGIKVNGEIKDVNRIQGGFRFNATNFQVLNKTEVSESGWTKSWVLENNWLTLRPYSESGGDEIKDAKDEILATLQFKVIKAVDQTASFVFRNVKVKTKDNPEVLAETITGATDKEVSVLSVTNSEKDNRQFELAVPTGVKVPAGRSVTVPVQVKANTGFDTLGIVVKYNKDWIKDVKVKASSAMDAYVESYQYNVEEPGTLKISLLNTGDVKITGDLFYLTFDVDVTVVEGTPIPIQVEVVELKNYSDTTMAGEKKTVVGSLSVTKAINKGDVNMDGAISLVDATYLLQYYNGVRDLNEIQLDVGDVNGSGNINLTDVLWILKKYNGENITFVES